jgi:LmbE family N-acetylglucosaminyl deacetylase
VTWDGPAAGERVLLFAPHPDDETLAAGGLLQRALAGGGRSIVVFATDGENNPWTQRLVEKRLHVGPEDSARFGRRRRQEALAALEVLGIPTADAVFLGLPDQAITGLILSNDGKAIDRLVALIRERRPTLLIAPCLFDLHPDHSALAVLVRCALDRFAPGERPRLFSYLIHRTRSDHASDPVDDPAALRFVPSAIEQDRKIRAIGCHATQLVVHRRKFLSTASRPEIFFPEEAPPRPNGLHPVRGVRLGPDALRLDLALHPRLGAFGRPTLHLASDAPGERRSLSFDLRWRRRSVDVTDSRTRATQGRAALSGGRRGGTVEVPLRALPDKGRLYVKLERRFGFFDEGGWLEIDVPRHAPRVPVS